MYPSTNNVWTTNNNIHPSWNPQYAGPQRYPVVIQATPARRTLLLVAIIVPLALLGALGVGLGVGIALTVNQHSSPIVYTTVAPFPAIPLYANCSQIVITPKIINGYEAIPNSWPWVVYVKTESSGGSLRCDGGVVHPHWVVTAGHCVDIISPKSTVIFGSHDLTASSGTVTMVADKVIQHPYFSFTETLVQYDIALLYFSTAIPFNNRIQAACFPSAGQTVSTGLYYVAGWGRTANDGPTSNVLLETQLPVIPDANCSDYGIPSEEFLCVGLGKGDSSICQGDSGSPLVFEQSPRKWTIVGVASFVSGNGCNTGSMGFTDLTFYRDWVLTTINKITPIH